MGAFEGWMLGYLLNSLWMVPVVFAGAWVVAWVVRSTGPLVEHRVWVSALVVESLLPGLPAGVWDWVRGFGLLGRHQGGAKGQVSVVIGPGVGLGVVHLPVVVLGAICALYGVVVVYFLARLGWGLWRVSALRRESVPVVLAGEAALCWARCAERFGVEDAEVGSVVGVPGPMAIGVWRKTILLPAGMMDDLPEDEMETVIAHEFAHLRRRDFGMNLLYEVLALPVLWHPVFRLTRERVIASREEVCDRMAAEAVAGRERYARSLLRLASRMVQGRPARVPHAIGIFDANTLERRIMKLTMRQVEVKGLRRVAVLAACVAFGLGTCGSALAFRMDVGAVSAASEARAGGEAMKVSAAVMQGNILTRINPVYPPAAKEAKIQGAVVLRAVIGTNGTVENLQVVSGPKELLGSSIDAVRQWVYKPYLLNGQPTEVETTITVNYTLQE